MELRPRRGRSSQPPSTPTIAKPSPRPPPQSSARKKPAPPPATPIYIPSDDEGADAKPIRDDVAVAATGDEAALKQVDQDIILPNDSEFETPPSRIAKARHVRNMAAPSNAKGKNKVTSSVKNIVETIFSTPIASKDSTCIADTCMEEACIADDSSIAALEKVELNEATTGRVPGVRNGDVAMEEKETPEVLSENVSRYSSIESAGVEISVLVQKMGVKKVEVLSPSNKGKKGQSSKKKSGKKRAENTMDNVLNGEVCYEAADAETDQVDDNAPVVATDFQEDHHTISLILSDDETGQVLKDAIWCEAKASASNEAASTEHGQAEVSNACSKGKKRSKKKDNIEEEDCGRKLFDENNDASLAHMDKEPEDQLWHKLDIATNLRKEDGERRIDTVNIENYEEERVITDSKRPTCKSPRRNLNAHTVADLEMLDSDGGKLVTSAAAGMEGKGFGNVYVHDVSEDSSHGAVSSSNEGDEDTGNDQDDTSEVKHEETITSFEGNSVHDVECNNNDDNDDVSSCSDDDGEDEMASVFVNSMKAHLQKISGPSVINMPKEALERTESPSTKVAVKASCVNGSNGSSTGYGLSWSPDIVLSASKSLIGQAGKSKNIAEARPNTIWGRDQCLQDGLCVPPVDPLKLNKLAKRQKDDTTGAKWFNLAAPTITPEIKKELQILKLRGALDPKRHYKAEDSKGLPKYFQIGTVVGGPADFFSGRLTKKEQKTSLAGELLSDSSLTAYRKRKYTQIQDQKQAGGKGFWKKNKSKRTPAWAKI